MQAGICDAQSVNAGDDLFKLDLPTALQGHPIVKTLPESRLGKRMRTTPEEQFPIATSQQRRTYIFRRVAAIALAAALVLSIPSVRAADKGKWIGTWAASPQPVWNADFFAPINFPRNLWNQTIRQIVRVSIGGSQVRVELSNGRQIAVVRKRAGRCLAFHGDGVG